MGWFCPVKWLASELTRLATCPQSKASLLPFAADKYNAHCVTIDRERMPLRLNAANLSLTPCKPDADGAYSVGSVAAENGR